MKAPNFTTTQSLTGQAKVQSLNSIYNRVTLLKSKNVSRKLVNKNHSQIQHFLTLQDQIPSVQTHKLQDSLISVNSIINKQRFLDDKQTDNLQTNLWSSHKNAPSKLKAFQTLNERPETMMNAQSHQRRKLTTTNQTLNTISKSITDKPSYQNNRVFLMTNYRRNSFNQTTFVQNNKSKKTIEMVSKKSQQQGRRPMTSSIGRQRIGSRVSELSRAKQLLRDKSSPSEDLRKKTSLGRMKKQLTGSRKNIQGSRVSLLRGETRVNTYKKQILRFEELYQCLSGILGSIKQGIEQVQKAVSRYAKLIQDKKASFIDDFMTDREARLQKIVRTTRLHQTLSICYLFLQIAQQRIQNNESYLVNFIGHSLSNLLLVVRLYILKQRRHDFERSQFEQALTQLQISSYGEGLTDVSDILLRIQHNNEIITMIHKRLGRNNEKFEGCIRTFFKNAERQKYSCSLCCHYIFEFLAMHIHELYMLDISPTLQLAPQPYTPPAQREYTLVIEPLGILEKNGKYRPYLNQFMRWATKHFDIVLWTWELPYAVEHIYDELSPYLTSRLYRHHCTMENEIYVKDLSRLGRDLDKTIIIDFDKRIFGHHLSNGIQCRWKGGQSDQNLLVLSEIFEEMVTSATSIQDTMTFYSQELLSIRGY